MNFFKFVGCSLIGLCLTLLVAAFFDDGLLFVFLSIVCTAGISLVGWIPLWFTVGFIIVSVIGSSMKSAPEQSRPSDPNQPLLVEYIGKALAKGRWSREQIDEHLRKNGWTNDEIQQAHNAVSAQRG